MILEAILKLLFLDDEVVRHEALDRWCQGAHHCYTYDSCIRLLKNNEYDIVSLDHDLSVEMAAGIAPADELTGTDVAKFIAQMDRKPTHAILHTFSMPGAARMGAILREAGLSVFRVPFGFKPEIYKNLSL